MAEEAARLIRLLVEPHAGRPAATALTGCGAIDILAAVVGDGSAFSGASRLDGIGDAGALAGAATQISRAGSARNSATAARLICLLAERHAGRSIAAALTNVRAVDALAAVVDHSSAFSSAGRLVGVGDAGAFATATTQTCRAFVATLAAVVRVGIEIDAGVAALFGLAARQTRVARVRVMPAAREGAIQAIGAKCSQEAAGQAEGRATRARRFKGTDERIETTWIHLALSPNRTLAGATAGGAIL